MRPEGRYPVSAIAAAPGRLREWGRFWTRREALPPFLLLLALAAVFLFGNDRGHFYRGGHHDWLTSQHLTQAVNLSPRQNFLLYISRTPDAEGNTAYTTYARWPIGSYALVKVATLPFGDNLAAGIYAARIVMLLLFAAAAVLAYLALARLCRDVCRDGWVALTATLLAFSSYHCLYYNDAFAPDAAPGLFGALLAFHGMAVFEQEGRFRQLLIKSCAGLLLCWPVYALLLPYIVFGIAREAFRARAGALPSVKLGGWGQIRRGIVALLSGRYLQLGVVTLCFGIAVLGFNVVNEYFAFDREIPLAELPTLARAEFHYSGKPIEDYAVTSDWGTFLEQQFHRIGKMTQPYFMSPFDLDWVPEDANYLSLITGAAAVAVGGIGLIFVRHKMLLATGLLAGFVWTLPLRNWAALHNFQALFYIGIPLAAFALIMLYIRRLSGPPLAAVFAVAAMAAFVVSAAAMAGVGHDYAVSKAEKAVMQDFAVIRELVNDTDGVVYVAAKETDPELFGAPLASGYYLAGKFVLFAHYNFETRVADQVPELRAWADYVVIPEREPGPALLTPDNRRVFLYDRAIYDGQYDAATLGRPIIAADWAVYFKYDRLIYVSDNCANANAAFFLHLLPRNADDLPEHSKAHGFENRDFLFADYDIGRRGGDRCVAARNMPEYEVGRIFTGQYTEAGRLWEAEYLFE